MAVTIPKVLGKSGGKLSNVIVYLVGPDRIPDFDLSILHRIKSFKGPGVCKNDWDAVKDVRDGELVALFRGKTVDELIDVRGLEW